jgi:hypothetical protein
MKNPSLVILLSLSLMHQVNSQIVPSQRQSSWAETGYPDSIPEPTLILNVMSFGATGDGLTDDYSAITNTINALNGSRGVVYFPAGEYKIGSTLNLPDSVILRGAGSDSTHLKFDLQGSVGNGINISGSVNSSFDTVVGAFQGLNYLTIIDPSIYQPGMYIELVLDNGTWDIQPVSWADNSVGQILRIDSIVPTGVGGALFLQSVLRADYTAGTWGSNARIRIIEPAKEVGIECLQISRADSVAPGVCYNIWFNYAVNCWVRGVESSKSIGSHIQIDGSSRISLRGNYIHHAYAYDGTSTHGYGITLFNHSGECRIENNIMRFLRHSISLQTGANGNVIAYNYSLEPNRSEFPSDYGADISMHGHFPFLNLFEGNIVQNIQLDQTWGPSGPYNTFFRNRAELYGILMTSGSVESDEQHFVGNEVTSTAPFTGNYVLAGTGHIEFGNMIRGVLTPAGTSPLNDSSYYLSSAPSFWNTTVWPSIGIPAAPGSGSNPARDRYISGSGFTVCSDDITTGISQTEENNLISIFPNPFGNELYIYTADTKQQWTNIICLELSGREIFRLSQWTYPGNNKINLEIGNQIPEGIYILKIETEKENKSFRLLHRK